MSPDHDIDTSGEYDYPPRKWQHEWVRPSSVAWGGDDAFAAINPSRPPSVADIPRILRDLERPGDMPTVSDLVEERDKLREWVTAMLADVQRDVCGHCQIEVSLTDPALHDESCPWRVASQYLERLDGQTAGHNVPSGRPTVVCLCGSTRFYEAFQRANYEETMAGRIVLTVGFYPHSQEQAHGETVGCTPEQKAALDELHLRKIDLADEILVLNVGGYVGESTRREIAYARAHGKRVRWLEMHGQEENK